jgi:hypothetical protein
LPFSSLAQEKPSAPEELEVEHYSLEKMDLTGIMVLREKK